MAFDGDFDRCFFFDHLGGFIPGEYMVGLLAEVFLKEKGATIIHDPRVVWNTLDLVGKCGGQPVVSKTGHAFVKAAMRKMDAVYGGENIGSSLLQGFRLLRQWDNSMALSLGISIGV